MTQRTWWAWSTRRQTALTLLLLWIVLVALRYGARLFGPGAGPRGPASLLLLTASVNLFWLVAVPGLLAIRKVAMRVAGSLRLRPWGFAAMVGGLAAIEPLWYRIVLAAFGGAPNAWGPAVVQRADVNVLIGALVLALLTFRDRLARAAHQGRQQCLLASALNDAELQALGLQLQPHFLFNTLQLAAEAAYVDLGAAQCIARDLRHLLERSFGFEGQTLVRVSEEEAFVRAYVDIQQRRFGQRLTVLIDVAVDALDIGIPPLLLQPLIENSIRHGIGPVARPGSVAVSVRLAADQLRIVVADDGIGFHGAALRGVVSGLGLDLTRRRLEAIFGGAYDLSTADGRTGGAKVTVSIPARQWSAGSARAPTTVSGNYDDLRADAPTRPIRWHPFAHVITACLLVGLLVTVGPRLVGSPTSTDVGDDARYAMLAPAFVLLYAVSVLSFRSYDLGSWLRARALTSDQLWKQLETTKARVDGLRVGKTIMIRALDDLDRAPDADAFDRIVLDASSLMRNLFATLDASWPAAPTAPAAPAAPVARPVAPAPAHHPMGS